MDILEEIDVFLSACQLTQDESNNLVFNGKTGCFESKYLADWFVNQINFGWKLWRQAQAVPEGFVLVSAEQMSQWGHMANCAQEYGCPECYEARGYAHSLACEINAYFDISEAQEQK